MGEVFQNTDHFTPTLTLPLKRGGNINEVTIYLWPICIQIANFMRWVLMCVN